MPIADTLRPESISEIIGQEHLIGPGKPIAKMVEKDAVKSMLLHGLSGIGKTTIARCLANDTACEFIELNATNSKIADIRKVVTQSEARKRNGTTTIVFVDEIHRWAKNIQDALLPSVEDGTIVLVGSTTEKPAFAVNSALLSRLQSFELKQLTHKHMMMALLKVIKYYKEEKKKEIKINKDSALKLIKKCSGDIRKLMTSLETIIEVLLEDNNEICEDIIDVAMPDKFFYFDKTGNEHFDMAQNMQCAIQCSDANSAVYWLAKWLMSGEDPVYIARRILISSSEDCQDPFVSCIAHNAYIAAKEIGYPECKIPMSHAVIAISCSKRDRTAINAISHAIQDIENGNEVLAIHANSDDHNTNLGYTKINAKYV